MDCRKADQLMMKYMDKTITEDEAVLLGEHVDVCELCREAFTIYDEMMDHFSGVELIEAPDNFEALVMEKIALLPPLSEHNSERMDNMIHIVWGTVSVLLGLGTIVAINNEAIMQYLLGSEALSSYSDVLLPLTTYMNTLFDNVSLAMYNIFRGMNNFISEAKYYMAAILVFIVSIQVFIYKKDKVEA